VLTPSTGSAITIPVTDRQVAFSAAMVVVNPDAALAPGIVYEMTMATDVIQDTFGFNGFSGLGGLGKETYSFTVAQSGSTVKVTFVNTSFAATSAGYMVDNGGGYAYRNGYYYGWKCDGAPMDLSTLHADNMKSWGAYMDRHNHCQGTTSWDIAVANGVYNIVVVMPQGNHAGCTIEGTASGGTSGSFTYTANSVTVTDGKVTIAGDFPTCNGMQEVRIEEPTNVNNGCTQKLDGKVCGPVQDLHLPAGECMMLVKPAGSACNRELTSVTEPLNPVHIYPVPSDPRLVPMIRL